MVTQSRTYRTIRRKLYKSSRFTKSTDSDYQVRENKLTTTVRFASLRLLLPTKSSEIVNIFEKYRT